MLAWFGRSIPTVQRLGKWALLARIIAWTRIISTYVRRGLRYASTPWWRLGAAQIATIHGVHRRGSLEVQTLSALEGVRVAFPGLALLYFWHSRGHWWVELAPRTCVSRFAYRRQEETTYRPLPVNPLSVGEGLLLWDTRSGIRLAVMGGHEPAQDCAAALFAGDDALRFPAGRRPAWRENAV